MCERDFVEILANALPPVPGIRNAGRSRAVVLVLLSRQAGVSHVVFQERAAGIAQPGEIGFPGGKVEPELDRTAEDTALRETEEELGLPRNAVSVLGRLDSLLTRLGVLIDVVVGVTEVPVSGMRPNPAEVARIFALPLNWLLEQRPVQYGVIVKSHPSRIHPLTGEEEVLLPAAELSLPDRYGQPWGETIHPILVYRTPQGVIWGITADILQDFLAKCRESGVNQS